MRCCQLLVGVPSETVTERSQSVQTKVGSVATESSNVQLCCAKLKPVLVRGREMGSAAEQGDVIIAGGGPAGSATAIRARQLGYRALVLEAETFPRHHVGESL